MLSITRVLQLSVAASVISSCLAAAAEQHITVYSWPVASSSPQELAKISYNADSDFAAVTKYTPPKESKSDSNSGLVRVGLYDPKTSDWRGVVTAPTSFNSAYQQKIELHVDEESRVWHVGFAAYPKPKPAPVKNAKGKKSAAEDSQVVVEIIKPTLGPTPHLNKPVVLTPDGKVPDKEGEKTFLQKYWWAIGLFLLVQILVGGAGGAGK